MSRDQENFTANYAGMGEPELMQIARSYDSLTDAAKGAIRAEFARRNLDPPEVEENDGPSEQRRLVTVGRYRDLSEADIARSVLESTRMRTYLWNENLVRVDWPVSNAIGGVQLRVEAEDEPGALELLAQPLPATISYDDNETFTQPRCPKCGSSNIASSQFLGVPEPVPADSDVWRCNACGECWEQTED